jgi:hypothetical protein
MSTRIARFAFALVATIGLSGCGSEASPEPEAPVRTARARTEKRRPARPVETARVRREDDTPTSDAEPGSYEDAVGRTATTLDDEVLSPSECGGPVSSRLVLDCGIEGHMSIKIAVQHGQLIGVTALSEPKQPQVEACVLDHAKKLAWRKVAGLTTCTRNFKVD